LGINVNDYLADPVGYIDQLVPGYSAALTGVGSLDVPLSSTVVSSLNLTNSMMSDALNSTADEVQRKYGGIGALAAASAAQDENFAAWRQRNNEIWTANQNNAAAMADWEAMLEQWNAEWAQWNAENALSRPF
jgi:hypothetical protein